MGWSPSLTRSVVLLSLFTSSLAVTSTKSLPAFDSIFVCAPLNVLVVPSTDGSSQIRLEADMASSISATVSGSQLSIETTGTINAKGNIKIMVLMPPTALQALEVRSSSDVYLAPGFVSKTLQLTAGMLGGAISASQLTIDQLYVSAAGLAKVTVEGTFGDVSVSAQGASSMHIAGLEKKATLNLSGLPDVAITAKNNGAAIVGTSEGSQVLYNQGTCNVKGAMAGGALCVRSTGLAISASPLRWTCKVSITGTNKCQTSGSSASTMSSTGSDCSTMTWKGATKASEERPTSTRKLHQTIISSASSSSSSSGSKPSSYTYSTTTTGADGQPQVTSCSFVNNVGGCQVNGNPVPVQQLGVDFPPSPSPATEADPLLSQPIKAVTQAANAATSISTATSTTTGGTSCVFVNGIGGCTG